MTRSIAPENLKKLSWLDEQVSTTTSSSSVSTSTSSFATGSFPLSVDELVNHGRVFYSNQQDAGKFVGVPIALQQTLDYIENEGRVATLPYHLAGKAAVDKSNYLWTQWFTAFTEENVGIDKTKSNRPTLITVHGGGILTPDRITRAYAEGLTAQNAAKLAEQEFAEILEGKLPDGNYIPVFTVDDVKKDRITDPFGQYGVIMPLEEAKATSSGYHTKSDFLNNSLVLARAGTRQHLEAYFDKAQSGGSVGNWHPFGRIDPAQPQGRLLFLSGNKLGLDGDNDLLNIGRFVGVAPEAPRARKPA